MINVQEATKKAIAYMESFYSGLQNIQLEEVELEDDRNHWQITLSFLDQESMGLPIYPRPKKYKIFRIDSTTGDVISMKIRDIR